MSDGERFLLAVAGFAVAFTSMIAVNVIGEVVLYRLHRDHPVTWERLGRPGVPLVALPNSSFDPQTRARALQKIWRWAWRLPEEMRGDARLLLLSRLYVALFVPTVLGAVAFWQVFFLESER